MSVVFLDSGPDLLFTRFERSTVPKIKDPQKNRAFESFLLSDVWRITEYEERFPASWSSRAELEPFL
jgi:hypothetical protein